MGTRPTWLHVFRDGDLSAVLQRQIPLHDHAGLLPTGRNFGGDSLMVF